MKNPVVTSISLEREQSRFLDWYATAKNSSKSEIIRKLIDNLIERESGFYNYYKFVEQKGKKNAIPKK